IVPMPLPWLARIAPHNADVWARSMRALRGPEPEWATISLDPMATRVEVLRGVTYLCVFVAALRIANRREGVMFLERALILAVSAIAVTAILHPAIGAERVFGIYQARDTTAPYGPILNPNHLAGYLNIGFAIALASLLSPAPILPRP